MLAQKIKVKKSLFILPFVTYTWGHLSLYSTRTQNTWRRGLALGNAPDARFLRYPTQNIPTCWYILALPPTPILKFALPPTPTPDASQWNIGVVGTQRKIFALAMYISCFLCRFHLRLVANANPVSGGIWALVFIINI